MQLYGIGQPLTNQMLKFSGNQFGPQEFGQPQATNQHAFQTPQIPQAQVPQAPVAPQQPVAPTTNTLSPEGHFKTVSPNFQMPNFGPKAGIPGGTTGPNSVTGCFDIDYLTPNRG